MKFRSDEFRQKIFPDCICSWQTLIHGDKVSCHVQLFSQFIVKSVQKTSDTGEVRHKIISEVFDLQVFQVILALAIHKETERPFYTTEGHCFCVLIFQVVFPRTIKQGFGLRNISVQYLVCCGYIGYIGEML